MATAKATAKAKANKKTNKKAKATHKATHKENTKKVKEMEKIEIGTGTMNAGIDLATWGTEEAAIPIPVPVAIEPEPAPEPEPLVQVLEPVGIVPVEPARVDRAVNARLIAHCGAWDVQRAALGSFTVPAPSKRHRPVGHNVFIDWLEEHMGTLGLTVKDQGYAVTKEGNKLFGIWKLQGDGICVQPDYEIAFGIRSSYDRSLAFGLAIGTNVFVCDNLCFFGTQISVRRHTENAMRDLSGIVNRMVGNLLDFQKVLTLEIDAMKNWQLTDAEANDLIVKGVRAEAVPITRAMDVIDAWYNPKDEGTGEFAPRTAWTLHNAFTEASKRRKPWDQWEGTVELSKLFRGEMVARKLIAPLTIAAEGAVV